MPPPDEIRAQLDRILTSRTLNGSEQLKRLLRVILDRTLSGDVDSVKEYTLGVEAFGRPEDFDPKVDPIVRVQARRLRSKLEEYYAAEGVSDSLVITIPKGGYLPNFASNARPPWVRKRWLAAAAMLAAALIGWFALEQTAQADPQSLAVLPLRNFSGDPAKQWVADKTTEALLTELGRVRALRVASGTTTRRFAESDQPLPAIARQLGVRWIVEGGIGLERGEVLLKIRLVDSDSDRKIWANAFTASLDTLSSMQTKAASEITQAIEKIQ